MPTFETLAEIFTLVILIGYLLYKRRQRRVQRWNEPISEWNGEVMKVENVLPQIEKLRANYLAEMHPNRDQTVLREGLLQQARRSIGRSAYFHSEGDEEDRRASASGN